MVSNFDYYAFQKNFVINKINEEIEFLETVIYKDFAPIDEYLKYLKARIGIDRVEEKNVTYQDNTGVRREIKKMNMDEYSKDLDMIVYKRPWIKLKEFHKCIKIRQFIDGLEYGKKCKPKDVEKNKNYLKQEICDGLKNKKFGKNKAEVIYDPENMVITSISCLDYNKKTGLYEIDWDA